MKDIWFSSKGFTNIPEYLLIPNFTICFEDSKYQINSLLADFISPKISRIHQAEPFCSSITIPIKDPNHFFNNIVFSLRGNSLSVNDQSIFFYLYVFNFLENEDVVLSLEELKPTKLTKENIISIIEHKIQANFSIKNELSFLASNFFDIPYEQLSMLSSDILSKVFQNENFIAETEDVVLHFVNKIVDEKGDDYKILYNFILYENLSNEKIIDFLNNFDSCDLSGQIWYSLCQRMSKSINSNIVSHRYHQNNQNDKNQRTLKPELTEIKFRYYEGFVFNGILSYLTRQTNRNIQDAGLITASSSSIIGDRQQFHPKMVLNMSKSSYFMSKDVKDSWIMFDFKNMEIQISHYVIRTYGDTFNSHLKSWILEVSSDGHEWTVVDRRVTDYSLKEDWGTSAFKCSIKKRSRYVRLTQTGPNHRDTNCLLLCSIDFYGKLYK
ncbi:hypothetical protein M9Y10_005647 [Tritrichomonas musculus]|uniref:F5/8 type C domain-containing protein n=1 Tax=Tritrichomonas musculus TaxID=1915356 RepID=A0ABR2JCM9_9EUKA